MQVSGTMPGVGPGSAPAAGGVGWGGGGGGVSRVCLGPPMCVCVILGMGGHGNQSDGDGCHSERSRWLSSLGGVGGMNTNPPPSPAAPGAGVGAMSLAGLMPPGKSIHLAGSSIRDGTSGMSGSSLKPPCLQGRERGWGCQAGAAPPPQPLCLHLCSPGHRTAAPSPGHT